MNNDLYVPESEINSPLWKFELNYIKRELKEIRIDAGKNMIMSELIKQKSAVGYMTDRSFFKSGVSIKCHKCRKSLSFKRRGFGHGNDKGCNKYKCNFTFKISNNSKENNEETDDVNVVYDDNHVIKTMNKNEYTILSVMKNERHFPKILKKKEETNEKYTVTMPFYKSKKINYKEEISFVKDYIKSLLYTIKKLNEKGYAHGDIKPNNFLYNGPKKYWLIDFDSAYNDTISASHSSTFPFIPPEKNHYIAEYTDKLNFKSDLWSVGMILLYFMAKKKIFEQIDSKKGQKFNSVFIYVTLYGNNLKINPDYISSIKKYKVEYKENFIDNNCIRGGEKAKDLIKKLLELDVKKRVTLEDALSHCFFKNNKNNNSEEYIKYCLSLSNSNNFFKLTEVERNNLFKKCLVCKQFKKKKIYCEICKDAFHPECIKNNGIKYICERCKKKSFLGKKRKLKKEIETIININKQINKRFKPQKITIKLGRMVKNNLFAILKKIRMTFNDDLVYDDVKPNMNNSLIESNIYELSKDNKQIYDEFKCYSKRGLYPPVQIVYDTIQGYVVEASDSIEKNTLICEYAGDVFYLRNKLFSDNNSIMDLIAAPISDRSLVICPEKNCNLARFLSGINNKKSSKNQNVYSIRVAIDGHVHVLLIAKKYIEKGEILCYDYNAGGYNNYNTDNFI